MSLFQKSVQKKYINALDKFKVEAAYQRLLTHFGNPVIQENIRRAKEEQYQEGFLNQLFVEILGYRMQPQPFFNLITEQKNEKNSKKADGAILKNDKPIAVIELKSLKTVDLQSIELQAFSYKNNQSQCVYVITSNFQKLRFYIENAIDWEEFDLFDLSKERFQLLYLCLHAEHLLADLPLRVKRDSVQKEEDITKKLYNDYAGFKKALFKDILSKDKSLDRLVLFKKTQKLLDRFLFIFFAEDKGLLPPNSVKEIVHQWNTLKDLDAYQPLYNRFKQYFGYLNQGHQTQHYSIFAYNGGLFAPDDFLDKLTISDGLLYNYTQLLSGYDFETDVDTNILGHIFEHSLNETDEIAAAATHAALDKSKTKRKKDGIFYTPRYITKYIVENTVGALCQQKLTELGIEPNNMDIHADKETKNLVCKQIHAYRDWLLSITILDPACGSGAFLNQALTFLMEEHQRIDAMFKSLYDVPITLTDNVLQILENNIFGVDINEESVEIARLSLWLRTAKIGRKLNDLSRNILCGNSLISDPQVAGDSAFDWQKAFPQVFEKGGFDVVIGNPPYVRHELLSSTEKMWLIQNYQVGNGTADLYTYFYEKSLNVLGVNGMLGLITPNKFIKAGYGKNLRNWLGQFQIRKIIDFSELPVFSDAATFPCILLIDKRLSIEHTHFAKIQTLDFDNLTQIVHDTAFELPCTVFQQEQWQLANNDKSLIFDKMKQRSIALDEYIGGNIKYGIKTGFNEAFIIDEETKNKLIAQTPEAAEIIKPFLAGDNVRFYKIDYDNKYLIFARRGIDIHKYPSVLEHLKKYERRLTPDGKEGRKKGSYQWYEIQDAVDYYEDFEKPKIIYPDISKDRRMFLDTKGHFLGNTAYFIPTDNLYLLALLNSKLIFFYYKNNSSVLGDADKGGRMRWFKQDVEKLPIVTANETIQKELSLKSNNMLTLQAQLQAAQTDFLNLLTDNFEKLKVNKAIENWHENDFGAFKKLLEKQKIEIPLKKQKEWREVFDSEKATYVSLQTQIESTDKEINNRVYTLYELTEAEIQIIENQ